MSGMAMMNVSWRRRGAARGENTSWIQWVGRNRCIGWGKINTVRGTSWIVSGMSWTQFVGDELDTIGGTSWIQLVGSWDELDTVGGMSWIQLVG